jgi:hypothetical protein
MHLFDGRESSQVLELFVAIHDTMVTRYSAMGRLTCFTTANTK